MVVMLMGVARVRGREVGWGVVGVRWGVGLKRLVVLVMVALAVPKRRMVVNATKGLKIAKPSYMLGF
jgi:hypothetical protein